MKIRLLLMVSAFVSMQCAAQIEGAVIDAASKAAIPYVNVWVAGKSDGVTSDQAGHFLLAGASLSDTLIFSCAGYQMKRAIIRDGIEKIELERNIIALRRITIQSKKTKRVQEVVGKFNPSTINSFWMSTDKPYMIGRFFPYNHAFKHLPIVRNIKAYLSCRDANGIARVRLYAADTNGLPDKEISEGNIFIHAQNGSRISTVELKDYGLEFPRTGLVVVLESMIIPENRYEVQLTQEDRILVRYNPSLGVIATQPEDGTSINFFKGHWEKKQSPFPAWNRLTSEEDEDGYAGKVAVPAIQITLSNY